MDVFNRFIFIFLQVMCDAYTPVGGPIPTNKRHVAAKIFSNLEVEKEVPCPLDIGKPLPKFGEWDVNDPSWSKGYTAIFNKARDEKKIGATADSPPKSDSMQQKPRAVIPGKPQSGTVNYQTYSLDKNQDYVLRFLHCSGSNYKHNANGGGGGQQHC